MRRLMAGTTLLLSTVSIAAAPVVTVPVGTAANTPSSTAAAAAPAAPVRAAAEEWRRIGLPFLWPNAGLSDIAAVGPADVWVAGAQGAFCIPQIASWGCYVRSDGNPVVRHWNGSAWEEFPLPGWNSHGAITSIGTVASDDVWVSTPPHVQPAYLAHFDGTAFTKIDPPESDVPVEVHGGAAGAWLSTTGGDAPLYRWTDGAWQPAQGTGLTRVEDVRARTATDAWAVGEAAGNRAAAAHWDGDSWTPVDYPGDDRRLTEVLPVSATEVWAAVYAAEYVVRWNGSTWSQIDLPSGTQWVDLAVDGSGTVWAGGLERIYVDGYGKWRPVLLSYTGGTWQRTTLSMPWGADEMTVNGLTAVPVTGALWLAATASNGPVVLTND
ncbi:MULTISPECIES: hypothetical protein [unclassified Spirillospora]|uniref:hypothetical protein n=1 Tax=unclassified Spirillospora TaxID=2642701 RepID=UPI00372037A0